MNDVFDFGQILSNLSLVLNGLLNSLEDAMTTPSIDIS
jgi:hypothetical protein